MSFASRNRSDHYFSLVGFDPALNHIAAIGHYQQNRVGTQAAVLESR
jgi:hypothetical protein